MLTTCRLGARTIAVVVGTGERQRTLDVHEDVLINTSEFFKAVLNEKRMKESGQQTVELLEHDPELFELFYHFLYTGQIFSAEEGDGRAVCGDTEFQRLIRAWLLGDQLASTSFKDALSDALLLKLHSDGRSPLGLQVELYPNSTGPSGMRRLLVDLAAGYWPVDVMEQRIEKRKEMYPADFLYDLAVVLMRARSPQKEKQLPATPTCEYHDHVAKGKPCYKTLF